VHAIVLLAVLKLTLRLELGPEYDSNANRSEIVAGVQNLDPPVGSALVRSTARVALAWKRGINLLRVTAGIGTKIFFEPAVLDQSVVAVQSSLDDRIRLGKVGELALIGDYYDAFQDLIAPTCTTCFRRRDFRTGQAAMRLTLFQGPGAFWIGAGYRGFVFKPDPEQYFNFHAPTGEVGASVTAQLGTEDNPQELTFAATYNLQRRGYNGNAQRLVNDPSCAPDQPLTEGCLGTSANDRVDLFHEASTELAYVGPLLASIGYTAQLNRSNSFGQSLIRHIVTLKIGYRLPWQLYASLKAQLMLGAGLDQVRIAQRISNLTFATIEDENRNAIIVDLERTFTRLGLSINARYSFFANELNEQQTSFRRHVAYLGLTYRFATR